ncbi:MAG TPA: peroxiredoxin-like family protein [Acidimicrobiia bacterium]|nr:peroxiredoxin-like family protein [Acidimicrobiia bacterium]
MTLSKELAERAARGHTELPKPTQDMYQRALAELEESGVADRALNEGDTAPDFELPNAVGETVRLSELLSSGPVVLSFYRGQWCPFCNLELRALQQAMADIEAAGATLVAISPNTPDTSMTTVEKHALTFPVLSDHDNLVAKQFNLVYEMTEENIENYREKGRDIPAMNGVDKWELPIPATYVIDSDRAIRYASVDANHRRRAEPSEVVAAATRLTASRS